MNLFAFILEMKPCWFNVNEIPFDKMWEDDPLWFPKLLKDEPIYLQCVFETDGLVFFFFRKQK